MKICYNFSGNVSEAAAPAEQGSATQAIPQATVIPGADSLIGDLLDMDLGGPSMVQQQMYPPQLVAPAQPSQGLDIFGEGLDNLVSGRGVKQLYRWDLFLLTNQLNPMT